MKMEFSSNMTWSPEQTSAELEIEERKTCRQSIPDFQTVRHTYAPQQRSVQTHVTMT